MFALRSLTLSSNWLLSRKPLRRSNRPWPNFCNPEKVQSAASWVPSRTSSSSPCIIMLKYAGDGSAPVSFFPFGDLKCSSKHSLKPPKHYLYIHAPSASPTVMSWLHCKHKAKKEVQQEKIVFFLLITHLSSGTSVCTQCRANNWWWTIFRRSTDP